MKRITLLFFLTALPVLAYGQCGGGSCDNMKVPEMQVNADDGIVWVQTSGTETALNCVPESGVFLKLNTTTDGGKNIYAALLSAQARDKAIDIRIQDNVSPCGIVYVRPKP